MKITFITAVWQRPEIFELFAKGINELKKMNPDIEIDVCVSGSEGVKSRRMVESEGFKYVEVTNNPLGRKMNCASLLAQSTNADYYILLGSDDIIHNNLFQKYLKLIEFKYDYLYLTDCYFYDIQKNQSLYWKGYNKNHNRGDALGPGRVISKRIMNRIRFKPWYDDKLNHVLDTAFDRIVNPHINANMKREINCKKENVHILDIKSSTNMTPFRVWDNSMIINNNIIKEKFRYLWNN